MTDDRTNTTNMSQFVVTDPLFAEQWYLWRPDVGINVLGAWQDYSGAGVKVAVLDSGIDFAHPDLALNYNPGLRLTIDGVLNTGVPDPSQLPGAAHGTAVAGIIAAANNGVGMIGVAHNASLTPIDKFGYGWDPLTDRLVAGLSSFDVVNSSWGYASLLVDDRTTIEPGSFWDILFTGMRDAVDQGRHGLGTILVQASGNFTMHHPNTDMNVMKHDLDTNTSGMLNSRFNIAVGATTFDGTITFYSVSGTSLLVVAPDGGLTGFNGATPGVVATDIAGEAGFNAGDFVSASGTSFAAPQVTGVVALMLEANPELGWRDVQQILAASARHTGAAIGETGITYSFGSFGNLWTVPNIYPWAVNNAETWNGGGYHYSGDYGFGLVDALAAVRLAESWQKQQTSTNEVSSSASLTGPWTLGDFETLTFQFEISADITVECVEILLDFDGEYESIADLDITLTSPDGTTYSVLHDAGTYWPMWDWTLMSRAYLGESAAGVWTLTVHDDEATRSGAFSNVSLTIYGAAASADDTYIYTNDFIKMLLLDPSRATLADNDGGVDTINLSAVSDDITVDLAAGAVIISGATVTLAPSSVFENVFAGDGDDVFVSNAIANRFIGGLGADTISYASSTQAVVVNMIAGVTWDGFVNDTLVGIENAIGSAFNDTLVGNGGDNVLEGGAGADFLRGAAGRDTVVYAASSAGVTVNLHTRVGAGGEAAGDTYQGVEDAVGSGFDDVFVSSTLANRFTGGLGADTVSYAAATQGVVIDMIAGVTWDGFVNDTLVSIENAIGSAFADTIVGDGGDNVLEGGAGADFLRGAAGRDTVVYAASASGVIVNLHTRVGAGGEAVGDTYQGIENAIGSGFDDVFVSSTVANRFTGGGGADTVSYVSSTQAVIVDMSAGVTWDGFVNDTLVSIENAVGSAFADTIVGNGADNVLEGGGGADLLRGGAGNDTIVLWANDAEGDVIQGFNGAGAAQGDGLLLLGYGTAAEGATLVQLDATHWQITSADGLIQDIITLANGASIDPSDFIFGN